MKQKFTINRFLKTLILTAIVFGPFALQAQWANVGSAGFTPGMASYTSIALDKNGKAFVAFSDSSNAYKAGVMRFDTSHWVRVGPAGISAGKAVGVSFALDTANRPYVAYGDSSSTGRLIVMRFNPGTNTWVQVSNNISLGAVYKNTSAVIDKHNNMYVAYTDMGDTGKIVVKKYNGLGFSVLYTTPGKGYYPSLVLNKASDTVYLGFKDQFNAGKASVVNVISKTYVGAAGFTPNAANYTSIASDTGNILHLAFQDSVTGGAGVVKFSGGTWIAVGSPSFSATPVTYTSIAISRRDTVFVAYSDTNGFATVMEYNGLGTTGWSGLGGAGFSAGPVSYVSLVVDTLGHPYIAYSDGGNINKATVMEYVCSSPYIPAVVSDSAICLGNQATLRIAGSSLNSSLQWQWYSGSCGGTLVDTTLAPEIIVSPIVTATYYVRGTGWCKIQDSCRAVTVVVDTLVAPSLHIAADKDSVCPGTAITFTAMPVSGGTAPIFQWKKNGQDLIVSGSHYTDSTLVNGDKITCILFPTSCSTLFLTTSNVLKVTVIPGPSANITANGPLTFCTGDSIVLQVAAGDSSYRWSNGDSVQAITVKTSGVYSVTASFNGCYAHNSVTVVAAAHNLSPVITHNNPLIICPGGHVMLDAGVGYSTYHWSTGDTTQTILADTTAIYHVSVTQNTCVGNASVSVKDSTGYQAQVHITPVTPVNICDGDTIVLNAGAGFDSYLWNTGDTTQTIRADSTANYFVNVTQNACPGADAVDLIVHTVPPPTILSSDSLFTICQGHSITLSTNFQYNSYLWSNGSTNPTILVTNPGTFNVTVSVNTCTGTAVAPVTITDFSHIAITLDTIQDTVGVTTIHVVPGIATNYFWQDSHASPYNTTADSLTVYCYMLTAERAKSAANWTIVDYPLTTIYLIMSLHGCNDTSASLTIPCTLVGSGINDISGLSNLALQPNPTGDVLNISYQLANETELQISIMDMQGRKLIPVLNEKKSGGIYTQQINVSNLASGVYMVNFESSEGRVIRRFVTE